MFLVISIFSYRRTHMEVKKLIYLSCGLGLCTIFGDVDYRSNNLKQNKKIENLTKSSGVTGPGIKVTYILTKFRHVCPTYKMAAATVKPSTCMNGLAGTLAKKLASSFEKT
jgi:hypothetical protein